MKNPFAQPAFKIIAFLLIVYACAGCIKFTPKPLSYPLSTDALAYIQLKVGKYFIYKDSAANVTDSVVVTQSLLQAIENRYGDNSQQYNLVLTEFSPNGKVWLSGTVPGDLFGRVVLISDDDSYHVLFEVVESNIPSMVVEGKTYTDVNLTTSWYGLENGPGSPFTTISANYWVKGVGLVKRSETKAGVTTTYTLLRNN